MHLVLAAIKRILFKVIKQYVVEAVVEELISKGADLAKDSTKTKIDDSAIDGIKEYKQEIIEHLKKVF